MTEKPLNEKLPGRYGKMTARQLNALTASFDRPIALRETRPLSPAERKQWQRAKRSPGRPRRGKGARVISLSVEQGLLQQADLAAKRTGLSRAAIFELGLRAVLKGITKAAG